MKIHRSLPPYIGSLIVWWVFSSWAALAFAQSSTGILVDASGSMLGFFTTGSIHELYRQIDGAIEEPRRAYYFKYRSEGKAIRGGLVPYHETEAADGGITLIDRGYQEMLEQHPDLGAMWLVTDNIQDPQGNVDEQGDINRFYNKFRQEKVKQVYIFPTTKAFRGPVYRRGGNTRLGNYRGERGIIIYAILFDDAQQAEFSRSVERLGISLNLPEGKGILAKPLERAVEAVEREFGLDDRDKKAPNRFVLHESKDGKNLKEFTSERIFSEGEPIGGEFLIQFQSYLDNISIVDKPEVNVKLLEDFKLSDFRADKPQVYAEPPRLEYDLMPGKLSEDIKIRILFPEGVRLAKTPGALLRSAFESKPGNYAGRIEVSLKIKKSQLALVEEIRNQYSTKDAGYFESLDPKYQTRIFGLEDLFRGKSQEDIDTIPRVYKINFKVSYPRWPAVVLPLFSLMTLALLIGAPLWLLRRSPDYRLETMEGGAYRFWLEPRRVNRAGQEEDELLPGGYGDVTSRGEPVHLSLLGSYLRGGHAIPLDGYPAARIKRSIGGVFVRAEKGFSVEGSRKKALSATPAGTDFYIERQEDGPSPEPSSKPHTTQDKRIDRSAGSPFDNYPDY